MRPVIISGGQSGVDRAALDAALLLDLPYEGWAPHGWLCEDRADLKHRYPRLRESPVAGYPARTRMNVALADMLLALVPDPSRPTRGSLLAIEQARLLGKPTLVTHPEDLEGVARFLGHSTVPGDCRVNVAGSRESKSPGIHDATLATLLTALAPWAGEKERNR